jgi:hypothetical protein
VPPTYADLATLKAQINVETADTSRDVLLTGALSAASRSIDKECGRRFYLDDDPVARVYRPNRRLVLDDDGEWIVTDDIGDLAGLVIETGTVGSWTVATGVETGPDNAIVRGRPVTALLRPAGVWGIYAPTSRVRVTARWGWPAVPDEIVQATMILAARLYRRKDSPEGVTGSAEWGVVRLSRTDPDVYALIKDFAMPGFG